MDTTGKVTSSDYLEMLWTNTFAQVDVPHNDARVRLIHIIIYLSIYIYASLTIQLLTGADYP